MPLTVAGDFTWPDERCVGIDALVEALSSSPLVINFEGALIEGAAESEEVANDLKFNLFSAGDAIAVLKQLNVVSVGLANNHIGDYPGACARTIDILESEGVRYFGLESIPFTDVHADDVVYRFIGVVSPLTEITQECDGLTANTFAPQKVLRLISEWRAESPDTRIVVFAHWGYELARFPLPADRAWAYQAIHAGADYVIGHHPHMVQGIERVGGGTIAYSLGNFVLPQANYRGRRLSYSDPAVATQLAMTLEDDPLLIWSMYEAGAQQIVVEGKERLSASDRCKALTPFAGMTELEYRRWFKQSRKSGAANIKRGFVTLWNYSGLWGLHVAAAFLYMRLRRLARSLLIRTGVHRPYNWGPK
jgi:hypothetical protein